MTKRTNHKKMMRKQLHLKNYELLRKFKICNKILNELMKYFEINISPRKFYLTKKR